MAAACCERVPVKTASAATVARMSLCIRFSVPNCGRDLVRMMRAPMPNPRRMPLMRPLIGGHEIRLRASPKIWLQHRPRIVPDRPLTPLPILARCPSSRASWIAGEVGCVDARRSRGGGCEFGRRRCCHRTSAVRRGHGQNQSTNGKSHENGPMHGHLLGVCAAARGPQVKSVGGNHSSPWPKGSTRD
jgi:hypothetical protein